METQIDPSIKPTKLNIQTKERQTIKIECEYKEYLHDIVFLMASRARWTSE
jgi:hypothetical protein